jgi:LuxR family maltose regulon positive regulatory protein
MMRQKTKNKPPRGERNLLRRPSLQAALECAVRQPLILVSAGPGFGKSAAISDFLRECDVIAPWIQLSESDNMVTRFWENYTSVFTRMSPEFERKSAHFGFPDNDEKILRYREMILDELKQGVKYVITFDDLHLIEAAPVKNFILKTFAAGLPDVTTILISRETPDLSLVPDAAKSAVHLTERDLRFSKNDVAAYLKLINAPCTAQQLEHLYSDTEGWAFAVNMGGMIMKRRAGSMPIRYALKQNIFRVFELEVFNKLSPEFQNFLIRLSLIEILPVSLAENLMPDQDMRVALGKLGSFLRRDEAQGVYRIHHLLLDYLKGKQCFLSEEERETTCEMAGQWCAANDYKVDALGYFEKSGNYKAIIQIAYTLPQVIPHDEGAYLLKILENAPSDVFDEFPAAYIVHVRILHSLGRIAEAGAKMRELIERFENEPPSPKRDRILFGIYNNLAFLKLTTCLSTRDYGFTHDFETADTYYRSCKEIVQGPITVVAVAHYACRVGVPDRTDMEQFIRQLTESIPYASNSMNGCMYGMDDLARSELAYYQSNLKEASHYAHASIKKSRSKHQYENENRAHFFLLRIAVHLGDYAQIRDIFEALDTLSQTADFFKGFQFHEVIFGWFYALIERLEHVPAWIRSNLYTASGSVLTQGIEDLAKLRYYLADKNDPAQLALLESRRNEFGMQNFLFGKVDAGACKAVGLYRLKETDDALKTFEETWRIAEPNGIFMPFIALGSNMRTLTTAALKDEKCKIPQHWLEDIHRQSTTLAKKVARLRSQFDAHERSDSAHLTLREKEILQDLSRGLSRTEIAAAHDISVSTVKVIIQIIYDKLQAKNAADAVRIAISMGEL